jgi:AraC-like DNA-binding protein
MDHRVRKAVAMAEEFLHKDWSAAKLAGLVNLSPSRFHQLFKEGMGEPPARYLRRLRMRRAQELLETTHLSVKQVMAGVGVSDESHFVRDFKKSCGLTPARYRERFLCDVGQNGTRPKSGRMASAPERGVPAQTAAPPPSAPASPPPPPKRASHPRQLSGATRSIRRGELLLLLKLRRASFAELTAAATERIVSEMPGDRHISYRPRRLPPLAERPHAPRRVYAADGAARRRG